METDDKNQESALKPKTPLLGYFKHRDDCIEEVTSVFVLVVHYEFKHIDPYERIGNSEDVERLRQTFQIKRQCSFHDIASPRKKDFFELISDDGKLLQLFHQTKTSDRKESTEKAPQLFILFILSHGDEDGLIYTDHKDENNYVNFTRNDVYDNLSKLKTFDNCLKMINFGPCRGLNNDVLISNFERTSNVLSKESLKVTKIKIIPHFKRNIVLFYSTVETMKALRNDKEGVAKKGTWFVQKTCDALDGLRKDTCLLELLTIIQNNIHQYTEQSMSPTVGQTPEFNIYGHLQLIFSPLDSSVVSTDAFDAKGNTSNVVSPHSMRRTHFFDWNSDSSEANIRGRRALIFCKKYDDQVKNMDSALTRSLLFETSIHNISMKTIDAFYERAFHNENICCCIILFYAEITVNHEGEVCTVVDGCKIPIGYIMNKCVGLAKESLFGKPVLFFFLHQLPSSICDEPITPKIQKLDALFTQFSNWLAFVATAEGSSRQLCKIFEADSLKNGVSLQESLYEMLGQEENDLELRVLLVSTLQFLIDFPALPSCFVKPSFEVDSKYKSYDELINQLKVKPGVWLLSSEPGMGKTTLILQIMNDLRKEIDTKIILVKLSDFYDFLRKRKRCTLVKFLAKALKSFDREDDLDKILCSENFFFLIDGFDEICPDFRNTILKFLREMIEKKLQFLVATRPEERDSLGKSLQGSMNVSTFSINGFDYFQQIELIKIVTKKSEIECKELRNSFIDNGMKDILKNPHHLTMICSSKRADNLYDVYQQILRQKIIQGMECKESIDANNIRSQKLVDDRISLLQDLAISHITQDITIMFDGSQATCINSTGIARMFGNQINFTHQTFAEYLVCKNFIDDIEDTQDVSVDIFEADSMKQCRKFLNIFLGASGSNEEFREKVRKYTIDHVPKSALLKILTEGLQNLFVTLKDQIKEALDAADTMDDSFLNSILLSALQSGSALISNFILEYNFEILINMELSRKNALELTITGIKNCTDALIIAKKLHKRNDSLVKRDFAFSTILQCAAQYSNAEMCRWLVEVGKVDVRSGGKVGETALNFAAKNYNFGLEVGKYLMSLGYSHVVDTFDIAVEYRNYDLAEYLHSSIADKRGRVKGLNILQHSAKREKSDFAKHIHAKNKIYILEKTDNGETALHLAAKFSDLKMCRWLVKNGVDLHALTREGNTALHEAASNQWDRSELVSYFVSMGVNINQKNFKDESPLCCAFLNEKFRIANEMLVYGADLNEKIKGCNIMHMFVKTDKLNIAKYVHEKDGKLMMELTENGETVLHLAASSSNLDMCSWLVEKGVELHALTIEVENVLHKVAGNTKFGSQLVTFFLSKNVDIKHENKQKRRPFDEAMSKKNLDVAVELLRHGGPNAMRKSEELLNTFVKKDHLRGAKVVHQINKDLIYERTGNGETALHLAACHSNLEMCKWLVENEVDVHALTNEGNNVLHESAFNLENGQKISSYFIAIGVRMDVENAQKRTPLEVATEKHNFKVVREIIDHGVDLSRKFGNLNILQKFVELDKLPLVKTINEKNGELIKEQTGDGESTLHVAARCNTLSTCEWLVENGADVLALSKNGNNVLHEVARINFVHNKEKANYFCASHVDVNQRNHNEETPLHLALAIANIDVAEVLVRWGAELRIKCNGGNLLHMCVQENRLESVKFLHKHDQELLLDTTDDGKTALHLASRHSDLEMCKWLVLNGVNVIALDNNGNNVLHESCYNPFYGSKMVSYFLSLGIDMTQINNDGKSPLLLASTLKNKKILIILSEHTTQEY